MRNAELEEAQAGIKIPGRNVGLKLNIQKTKIMASGPSSWEIVGETMEIVSDFIFGGSKSLQMVTSAIKRN